MPPIFAVICERAVLNITLADNTIRVSQGCNASFLIMGNLRCAIPVKEIIFFVDIEQTNRSGHAVKRRIGGIFLNRPPAWLRRIKSGPAKLGVVIEKHGSTRHMKSYLSISHSPIPRSFHSVGVQCGALLSQNFAAFAASLGSDGGISTGVYTGSPGLGTEPSESSPPRGQEFKYTHP